jgi:hypothetical protein
MKITLNKAYDFIGDFSEGYAKVKLNGKWGLIDGEGNEIVPPEYVQVGEFHEGLVAVKLKAENQNWGFIDKTGKVVVPPKYDDVSDFYQGYALVYLDGYWGRINTKGIEVLSCIYPEGHIEYIVPLKPEVENQ